MVYDTAAQHYTWGDVLPLPAGQKFPPPEGFTGHEGRAVTDADRERWKGWAGNLALRVPDGVVGLDVDQYGAKTGLDTIHQLEAALGPLPATYVSTGRPYASGSGIRFYTYPGGRLAGQVGESVETVQHGHRYAVVWPSVAGERVYQWYSPDGVPSGPPALEQLAELPAAWVEHLASGATQWSGSAAPDSVRDAFMAALVSDSRPCCPEMTSAVLSALSKLEAAGEGGRHDAMNAAVLRVVAVASEGHAGFPLAVAELSGAWDTVVADPARSSEFGRMVSTAAAKMASITPNPVMACGCVMFDQLAPSLPVRADLPAGSGPVSPASASDVSAPAAPAPFDPVGVVTERDLATSVLSYVSERARFAVDADAWLVRKPTGTWGLLAGSATDGAKALVQYAGGTHPRGDAKGVGEEVLRAVRYKRLTASGGVTAVAQMMNNHCRLGGPGTLQLVDLDTDPAILWAGGVPWDLARSTDGAVVAELDPNTPHLHSCLTAPADVPTPLWNAFLDAALPDPEHRAWVLRVMGVALTGESNRVLGILHGTPGSGKTSLLRLVESVMGSYAYAPPASILDANTATSVDEFRMMGKRMVWVDEGPRTGKWAMERLKFLTGGGAMTARDLYKSPVSWHPTHTLFLTSNDEPQVSDQAVKARVRPIAMSQPEDVVAPAMVAIGPLNGPAWKAEAPGVLWALIQEAARYLADRSTASNPAAVALELEAMSREQDNVIQWLDERTQPGDTPAMELYADFVDFSRASGVAPNKIETLTAWGRRLTLLGYPATKDRSGKRRPLRLSKGGSIGHVVAFPSPSQFVHGPVDNPVDNSGSGSSGAVTSSVETVASSGTTGHTEGAQLVTDQSQTATVAVETSECDQLAGDCDQLVASSPDNWSQANALVGPRKTGVCDQLNSFLPIVGRNKEEVNIYKKIGGKLATTGHTGHSPETGGLEAEQAQPVDNSAPEPVNLPAFKARGGEPMPVTLAEAQGVLAILAGQTATLDVETSGYPTGHPHYQLRTIQLGTRDWCVVLDATDPDHVAVARDVMHAACELVAHSATADVSLVARLTGDDPGPWWDKTTDTAVLAALADPAITGQHDSPKALSLESLSARLLADPFKPTTAKARVALFRQNKWLTNTEPTTPVERNGWAMVDPSDPAMVDYAASDVLDTADLALVLPKPAPALLARERAVAKMTARLPERGLALDAGRVAQMTDHHQAQADQLATKLADVWGLHKPSATAQVAEALRRVGAALPQTKTGRDSTAADVVDKLATKQGPAQELARTLLEWREHDKLLGTYLRPFGLQVTQGDGRTYPTILTMGAAATGRMSSVRPNIQQVPRPSEDESKPGGGGGLRGMIVADPGQAFISADFSSVEVRIAAAATGDPTLSAMVRDGTDLHGEVVKLAWGLEPGQPGFKEARYAAKRCIAQGQGVLTDHGVVPIERVTRAMRVWDGVEWVTHTGVEARGVKDVLTYQGLTATPDHKVYLTDGNTVCLAHAAQTGQRIATTADGTTPRALHRDYGRALHRRETPQGTDPVPQLRAGHGEGRDERTSGEGTWLPVHGTHEVDAAGKGFGRTLLRRQDTVYPGYSPGREVRGPGHTDAVQGRGPLREVDHGTPTAPRLSPGGGGPRGQRRSLRAGEYQAGGSTRQQREQGGDAVCAVHGPVGCPTTRRALAEARSPRPAVQLGLDDQATGTGAQPGINLADGTQWSRAQTYDITNAGPRHRFTVSGCLVSNSVFGYLYGAGMTRLALQLGEHGDKAGAVVDALRALTPTLVEWDRTLRNRVEAGLVTQWVHPSGRLGWFNKAQPHKSLNTVVQGWGRELLVDAMLKWEAMHPGCVMVPLHDELVIQCEAELADEYTKDLEACMTTTLGHGDALVPIVCEPDPPTVRWGTTEWLEG